MRNGRWNSLFAALCSVLLLASAAGAAMGKIENFTFSGIGPDDVLGLGESTKPDGRPDAVFTAEISGIGGAIKGLTLKAPDGKILWDTTAGNNISGMQVKDNTGKVLTESNGSMPLTPFVMGVGVTLTVPDNGIIAKGGKFTLTAKFLDNSENSSTITVPPTPTEAGTMKIASAAWAGRASRDLAGKNEKLQGDGSQDFRIQLVLDGAATVREATVRKTDGSAEWDTVPSNGKWLLVLLQEGKVLNRSDGSIYSAFKGKSSLELLLAGNGGIEKGNGAFEVVLTFSDGKTLRQAVAADSAAAGEMESPVLLGPGTRDVVGANESRTGNGKPDWQVNVKVLATGTITRMAIENTAGAAGAWDTLPGNKNWLLAVSDKDEKVLNRQDGAIRIPVTEPMEFRLRMEDNGSLARAGTKSVLSVTFDDGRVLKKEIVRKEQAAEEGSEFLFARLAGERKRDLVGKSEKPEGNGTGDWRFDVRFQAAGTLTGIRLVNTTKGGEWDTTPGNSKWLVGVTGPDNKLLNGANGAINLKVSGKTSLRLWVESNGKFEDSDSAYRITLIFSDGLLLEKEISAAQAKEKMVEEFLSARLAAERKKDLVGKSEKPGANGTMDRRFDVEFQADGILTGVRILNTARGGEWDTTPGNSKWLVAVTDGEDRLQNGSNGALSLKVADKTSLRLWVEDNGKFDDSSSAYRITLVFSDGLLLEKDIPASGAQKTEGSGTAVEKEKREIALTMPRKAYSSDYVGASENLGKNGQKDWLFTLFITGKGQVQSMTLENIGDGGIWDTVPSNGRWCLGVVYPGKGLLNRANGSVSFSVPPYDSLQLFVEDNGTLASKNAKFRLDVTWDDGTKSSTTVE